MLHMRQTLLRILLQVPQRNLGYSALLVVTSCLVVWSGIVNLTNVYGPVRSTAEFVLGLALLALGLQMLVDAIVLALPNN